MPKERSADWSPIPECMSKVIAAYHHTVAVVVFGFDGFLAK
jgi:hypothetical protein